MEAKKSKLSDSMTMMELYSEVVESILAKHFEQNRSVSTCLKKTRVKYELGKLAFDGLKQQKILFDCDFLAKVVDYNIIEFFETHVIKSGFLKPENTPIEFLHLTFQEYFAAYYVNTLAHDEQREIIREYKFYPHMQMFFAFWAGVIEDKEFLLGEIESEPKDLIGIYEFNLFLQCIKEIQKVSDERKKKIFDSFWDRLNILSSRNLMYERANELSYLTHLIDDAFRQKVFDRIENDEDYNVQKYLASSLAYLGKNDDTFVNKLVAMIYSIEVDDRVKGGIVQSLISLKRYDDNFIDRLFSIMIDVNVNDYLREDITKYILQYGNRDVQNKLFYILNEKHKVAYCIDVNEDKQLYFYKNSNQNFTEILNFCNEEQIHSLIHNNYKDRTLILVDKEKNILFKG